MPVDAAIEPGAFRHALGHFCTGVTVIAATTAEAEPVGFACQSFAALSLDPPLVLFCPAKTSRTWPLIEAAGSFCASVLAHDQVDVSSIFGRSSADKFAGVAWSPAPSGSPRIDASLVWVDCVLHDVLDGGDHHIVVGRVTAMGEPQAARPLLFYRGAYGVTERAEPTGVALDELITWADDWPREEVWF